MHHAARECFTKMNEKKIKMNVRFRSQCLLAVLRTQRIDKLTIKRTAEDPSSLSFELDCGRTGRHNTRTSSL